MRTLCIILGYLTGKWKVRCVECKNLDADGKCYGHQMPKEVVEKQISCGFWGRKPA